MTEWHPNEQMIDALKDVIRFLEYSGKVDMYDAFNFEATQLATDMQKKDISQKQEYEWKYAINKKERQRAHKN